MINSRTTPATTKRRAAQQVAAGQHQQPASNGSGSPGDRARSRSRSSAARAAARPAQFGQQRSRERDDPATIRPQERQRPRQQGSAQLLPRSGRPNRRPGANEAWRNFRDVENNQPIVAGVGHVQPAAFLGVGDACRSAESVVAFLADRPDDAVGATARTRPL